MDIQLVRIDDRLIHGQVVITWVTKLASTRIILCDNMVYANEWERELYLSCTSEEIETTILDVEQTIALLKEGGEDFSATILLVSGPAEIEALKSGGVQLPTVNVGGIHYKEGRKGYLPYLYLNDEDKASFKRCMELGVKFECLDVPTGCCVKLESLI